MARSAQRRPGQRRSAVLSREPRSIERELAFYRGVVSCLCSVVVGRDGAHRGLCAMPLMVPIGRICSPRRSCQREPSALRIISTVSGSPSGRRTPLRGPSEACELPFLRPVPRPRRRYYVELIVNARKSILFAEVFFTIASLGRPRRGAILSDFSEVNFTTQYLGSQQFDSVHQPGTW